MRLPQVEDALTTCKQHLERTRTEGTAVEPYLVRYLLVLIHAAYEQTIKDLILEKMKGVSDKHLSSFVTSVTGSVIRSIRITDLSGLLGRFGNDYKDVFSTKIPERGGAYRAYDDIMVNRRNIAHDVGQPMSLTFKDVENRFHESLAVLDAFSEALGVE